MSKLVALVGMNIGSERFEIGDTVTAGTEKQRKALVKDGYAEVVDAERVSPQKREEIIDGSPAPNPVVDRIDTKEE